jgi:hypothetical protein
MSGAQFWRHSESIRVLSHSNINHIKGEFDMKIMTSLLATAVAAAAIATPVAAQVPGTYSGTTADGQSVSFVVATDPNNGEYALTSASINFSAPCKNQDYTLNTGWGFGLEADIVKRRVVTTQSGNYFYFAINLLFSTDGQSATGTLESISPTLFQTPTATKPNTSAYCESPKASPDLDPAACCRFQELGQTEPAVTSFNHKD